MNLYMVEAYIVIFTYQELFHFFFFLLSIKNYLIIPYLFHQFHKKKLLCGIFKKFFLIIIWCVELQVENYT